jgi:23S rRNA (adenine2503-C2)-methyltransferase
MMELRSNNERLSNAVMGMGEPLANYWNVSTTYETELGIGARKITVSTVGGCTKYIEKLMNEDVQVRLALSLHCATDEERTALSYPLIEDMVDLTYYRCLPIREYITVKSQEIHLNGH